MDENGHVARASVRPVLVLSKVANVLGWIATVFFAFLLLIGIVGEDDGTGSKEIVLWLSILGLVAGLLLVAAGRSLRNRMRRLLRYADMIAGRNEISVDRLASVVQKPAQFVMRDLSDMIKGRFFVGAILDTDSRMLRFQSGEPVAGQTVVKCKSCGAENRIVKGTAGVCEYCGSPIQ